jgi:hypothetical protein
VTVAGEAERSTGNDAHQEYQAKQDMTGEQEDRRWEHRQGVRSSPGRFAS